MRKVVICGILLDSDAYPNSANTIQILKNNGHVIHDKSIKLEKHLWSSVSGSKISSLIAVLRLLTSSIFTVIRVLPYLRKKQIAVFITYPSIFPLLLLSPIKPFIRAQLICDFYISVWDSAFNDRSIGNKLSSFLIKKLEQLSLLTTDKLIVDTLKNKQFYKQSLGIAEHKILPLPLAIDESFNPCPFDRKPKKITRVLFIGTFVPLQGTDTIQQAISLLQNHPIHFTIIGSGQSSHNNEISTENVTRITEWMPLHAAEKLIEKSDICLGVFGGTPKSGRVLPYKVYLYLKHGKPVITQNAFSLPVNAVLPVTTIPPKSGEALAKAILTLSKNARPYSAHEVKAFYQKNLSNHQVKQAWEALLSTNESR